MNFVAFDFETANAKRNSACSLALTVVQNNQIVDELYSLINPKPILIIEISPFMESNLKWLPILRIFPNCGLISKAFLRLNRSLLRIMLLSTAAC